MKATFGRNAQRAMDGEAEKQHFSVDTITNANYDQIRVITPPSPVYNRIYMLYTYRDYCGPWTVPNTQMYHLFPMNSRGNTNTYRRHCLRLVLTG